MSDLTIISGPGTVIKDNNIFSKLEFMEKLTQDELESIYTLAKNDVSVEVWKDKFQASTKIDISSESTINGIRMLESKGIFTTDRANEILGIVVEPEQ